MSEPKKVPTQVLPSPYVGGVAVARAVGAAGAGGARTPLFAYRVFVAMAGPIHEVPVLDPRPPAAIDAMWLEASAAQQRRSRTADHQYEFARLKNKALEEKAKDPALGTEVELGDVASPPMELAGANEILRFQGAPDGKGYAALIAGLAVGIVCEGVIPQ